MNGSVFILKAEVTRSVCLHEAWNHLAQHPQQKYGDNCPSVATSTDSHNSNNIMSACLMEPK